jgi:hypothetical protein
MRIRRLEAVFLMRIRRLEAVFLMRIRMDLL